VHYKSPPEFLAYGIRLARNSQRVNATHRETRLIPLDMYVKQGEETISLPSRFPNIMSLRRGGNANVKANR